MIGLGDSNCLDRIQAARSGRPGRDATIASAQSPIGMLGAFILFFSFETASSPRQAEPNPQRIIGSANWHLIRPCLAGTNVCICVQSQPPRIRNWHAHISDSGRQCYKHILPRPATLFCGSHLPATWKASQDQTSGCRASFHKPRYIRFAQPNHLYKQVVVPRSFRHGPDGPPMRQVEDWISTI